MSTEKTITARARESGKMSADDLRAFLADLDRAGAPGDITLKALTGWRGGIKSISATVKDEARP